MQKKKKKKVISTHLLKLERKPSEHLQHDDCHIMRSLQFCIVEAEFSGTHKQIGKTACQVGVTQIIMFSGKKDTFSVVQCGGLSIRSKKKKRLLASKQSLSNLGKHPPHLRLIYGLCACAVFALFSARLGRVTTIYRSAVHQVMINGLRETIKYK